MVRLPAIPTTAAPFSVKVPPVLMFTSEPNASVAAEDAFSWKIPPLLIVTAPVNVLVPVADEMVRVPPVVAPTVVVPPTPRVKAPAVKVVPSPIERLLVLLLRVSAAPVVMVEVPVKPTFPATANVAPVVSAELPLNAIFPPTVVATVLAVTLPLRVRLPPMVVTPLMVLAPEVERVRLVYGVA